MTPAPHPFPIGFETVELARLLRRLYRARAGVGGFTEGQWRALWQLSRHEGISQAKLADILEMQPISLTRLLDRMEAAGLVERRPDPRDRRAVQLHLTAAAGPLLAQLHAMGREVAEIAVSTLAPAEQDTLYSLLRRVRLAIEEAERGADATPAPARA